MNAQDNLHVVLFWPQYIMTPYAGQNAQSLAAALALAEAALAVWIARSRNNLWLAPLVFAGFVAAHTVLGAVLGPVFLSRVLNNTETYSCTMPGYIMHYGKCVESASVTL